MIGLGVEGLLLAIQYEALREELSLTGVLIRSAAMLALLVYFHIIAEKNKSESRIIYKVYLGFNLLMVGVMLFLPPILFHTYPSEIPISTEELWSFDSPDEFNITPPAKIVPGWVDFLKENQWTPVGLCTMFFLIVFFVLGESKQTNEDDKESSVPEGKLQITSENGIIAYLQNDVAVLRENEESLSKEILSTRSSPESHLIVDEKLDRLMEQCKTLEQDEQKQRAQLESTISKLHLRLKSYQTDFLDILRKDNVKRSVFKPSWPARQHVLEYFRIELL